MKKLLLICFLLLAGCTQKETPKHHLMVFYSSTCASCTAFRRTVIPQLEDDMGDVLSIDLFNIDEEASIEAYAKVCSLLEDYIFREDDGDVPFIVLDGYFGKIGYEAGESLEIISQIQNAILNNEIPNKEDQLYHFQQGKTYY